VRRLSMKPLQRHSPRVTHPRRCRIPTSMMRTAAASNRPTSRLQFRRTRRIEVGALGGVDNTPREELLLYASDVGQTRVAVEQLTVMSHPVSPVDSVADSLPVEPRQSRF